MVVSKVRPVSVPAQQIISGPTYLGRLSAVAVKPGDTTGKIFRYGFDEVYIANDDTVAVVTDGRSGTTAAGWAINLCEINNTTGASDTQMNGMELVMSAPVNLIRRMMDVQRPDGSIVATFEYENSDHITEASTVTIGSNSNDGGSEAAETSDQDFEDDQSGKSDEGEALLVNNSHRVGYFPSPGDETLWIYNRAYTFRPNGKLRLISGETRNTVEVPVDCP